MRADRTIASGQTGLLTLAVVLATGALAVGAPSAAREPTFRVRADFDAPLNVDHGWAAAPGEPATVEVDRPFRIRLEADATGGGAPYVLQGRRNDGAWQTLEAQAFPYPKRDVEFDFADPAPGAGAPAWTFQAGDARHLQRLVEGADRFLRIDGGREGLAATYAPPWPLPEFGLAARFRLPLAGTGWAMMFAHRSGHDHGFVRIDEGKLAIGRVADGVEHLALRVDVPLHRGTWHEIEIELQNGQLGVTLDDEHGFEVPYPDAAPGLPGLLLAPGASLDLAEWAIEGVARTPGVSIVETSAYAPAAPTSDLLRGSSRPFAAGTGVSLAEQTPAWQAADHHGEFEWPLVIRRFGDGPQVNQAGDTFEFRMAGPGGHSATAQVTLAVPPGHLGGTYVENPGRIGPWQAANGDLYFIMEPTETDNRFMMLKSVDGGRSWAEVDGANRPATRDLESVDGRLIGDQVHIVHQVTESVRYHAFRTSDHPTHPDSWAIRDEVAAQAEAIAQMATLAARPDGTLVAIFLAENLYYVVRGRDGRWSRPLPIDPVDPVKPVIGTGPQAVAGRDGVVHLAYASSDGRLWYRQLRADGTLGARQVLAEGAGTSRAEYGAVLPLAYDAESDTLSIVYRLDDGRLWERRVSGAGDPAAPVPVSRQPVITDAVDSQQPAADVIALGMARHALWVDEDTRDIFSASAQGSEWSEPVLQVAGIEGSWVRGSVVRRSDGLLAYGYVYDAGSQGGSGLNRYAEVPLDLPPGGPRAPQ